MKLASANVSAERVALRYRTPCSWAMGGGQDSRLTLAHCESGQLLSVGVYVCLWCVEKFSRKTPFKLGELLERHFTIPAGTFR